MMKDLHTKLSYSQINNFNTCPRKWRYEYIDKAIGKQESIFLSYGSAVHLVLENLLKLYKGVPGEETLELGSTENSIIETGLEHVRSEIEPFKDDGDIELLVEQAKRNFDMFRNKKGFYSFLKDSPNIIGVEDDFTLTIPTLYKGDEIDINVRGFIDLVYEDKNGLVVVDHKTSKDKFQKQKRREDLQLPIYFLAVKDKYDEYPYKGTYNFTKLNTQQDTIFVPKVTIKMEEEMNMRGPKHIYGCDPTTTKRKIMETFKAMNDEKKRSEARPSPLCYWCNAKEFCPDRSYWKPKDKR